MGNNHSIAGYVDIWSNETGTSPVHTFRGPETVNQVHLSDNTHQLLVVNNNIARVEHVQDGCWQQQDLFECQAKVCATMTIIIGSSY